MATTKHRPKHKTVDEMLILMDDTNPVQIFGVSPFFKATKQHLNSDKCKYADPVTVCRILPDTAAVLQYGCCNQISIFSLFNHHFVKGLNLKICYTFCIVH